METCYSFMYILIINTPLIKREETYIKNFYNATLDIAIYKNDSS